MPTKNLFDFLLIKLNSLNVLNGSKSSRIVILTKEESLRIIYKFFTPLFFVQNDRTEKHSFKDLIQKQKMQPRKTAFH